VDSNRDRINKYNTQMSLSH